MTWNNLADMQWLCCVTSCTDVAAKVGDFQHTIKRAIPTGHTFKGYPIQCTTCDPTRIMQECARDVMCSEIMKARGDQVQHSLHIKIFPYPENTAAVWLMLSVTYRSVL